MRIELITLYNFLLAKAWFYSVTVYIGQEGTNNHYSDSKGEGAWSTKILLSLGKEGTYIAVTFTQLYGKITVSDPWLQILCRIVQEQNNLLIYFDLK